MTPTMQLYGETLLLSRLRQPGRKFNREASNLSQ
jgi:hypothetical protein